MSSSSPSAQPTPNKTHDNLHPDRIKRHPPMPRRDSGGTFTLNNPDDGTPIREMFTLDDGLLTITEKCIYRIQVADQIDPKRENAALPHNFQQKLFNHGTSSELLSKTLLQAKVMFRKEFQSADVDRAMLLAFDALSDAVAMHDAALSFSAAEQVEIEKAEALERKGGSQTIPAVGNVRGHCKSFAQKADHFSASLLGIVRLFFPEMKGKNWSEFRELVKSQYGEDDAFYQVMELTTPFLQLVRNARDCLEGTSKNSVS